jgi:class 3 adenylate cyclase
MLPIDVVVKLNSGADTAETFSSATLFFSTVVDFSLVTKSCKAMEIVNFLNNLYNTMDERMDTHDVYKVETISDSYLVASGLPIKNGDKLIYYYYCHVVHTQTQNFSCTSKTQFYNLGYIFTRVFRH